MKTLTRDQLVGWLDGLAKSTTLVAPVESEGKLSYRQVLGSAEIVLSFERTDISPKTWAFPSTESILEIREGRDVEILPAPPPAQKVVFGVRPCDARGLLAIDALFLDKAPRDERYAQHREATLLVGLACPQMWETCFCTAVGGAPNGTEGLDLTLTEIPDGYAVQAFTDRGGRLARQMPGQEQELELPQPTLREDVPHLQPSQAWRGAFDQALWLQLGERCLGCRACTFVCPTCRCFDIRDEVISSRRGSRRIERLRAWDACTMANYRRIAGGHNPRPSQETRLQNRFYCKFSYYPDDFGPLGCVGCGRCVDACPVGVDIREVMAEVDRITSAGEQ